MEISVIDHGTGVPSADRERIFERFERGTARMPSAQVRGSGIGLSIVKHVVEWHDGKVLVSETPGEGNVLTCVPPWERTLSGRAMIPREHPDFFRLPPPAGRSRESTIRLDAIGRFFHDGEPVENLKMATAFHSWLARHPDDGRPILVNDYDWTYLAVEGPLAFVSSRTRVENDRLWLTLLGGRRAGHSARRRGDGVLFAEVRSFRLRGPYRAKFLPSVQNAVGDLLNDRDSVDQAKSGDGHDGAPESRLYLRVGRGIIPIYPVANGSSGGAFS